MTDWQDISTAPKDGTLVLLAYSTGPDPFNWGMATARYRWSGWHTVNGNPRSFEPTHWQPLPEPPE